MTPLDVIRRLQATTSRNDKEQIIFDAWMNKCMDFFAGAKLANNGLLPFYVKQVAEITDDDGLIGILTFAQFNDLATSLAQRKVTGHAARDAIHAAAQTCDVATWNEFYRRILLKDLRIGVDKKIINKVLGKLLSSDPTAATYMLPEELCQLAESSDDHPKRMHGVKLLDVKLDGVRLLTILDKETGTVEQKTRSGKINSNFPQITTALKPLLDQLPCSMLLDGEVVSRNFQQLMRQVNRDKDVDTKDAKLACFDLVPMADYVNGICTVPQRDRHAMLSSLMGIFQQFTGDMVYVIPKKTVDLDTPEGQAEFKEFNRATVAAKLEGIMIKDPAAPYELKRSTAWLKMKPWIELSLEIVGFTEGTGKNVGRLGAFICKGEDGGKHIESKVAGMTDSQRLEFWVNRGKILGHIIEVWADALTLEDGETVWSLRFPRFKSFRGMTKGEKM